MQQFAPLDPGRRIRGAAALLPERWRRGGRDYVYRCAVRSTTRTRDLTAMSQHHLQGAAGSTGSADSGVDDTQFQQLFARLNAGDAEARAELVSTLYHQLKAIAHRELTRQGHDTMNTTGLVNEVYLKMFKHGNGDWEHSRQFLGTAAKAMRQLIVDHARMKKAVKRAGKRVPLDDFIDERAKNGDILALDEQLNRLAEVNEELVRIVEMRFFAGYSNADIARIMGMSANSVLRRWQTASAWLYERLKPTA
jgi:RNA polymerase sigma factor (TIGR02999 family)